jgi:RNA polymerase sigma-70 factor (ECF subfamily)
VGDDLAEIRRVLGGDHDAFRLLVERHQRRVFALVRNLIPDAHDAEDLAQDVFLTAYTRLATYDPRQAAFGTWLLTIARNRCLNALQKRRPLAGGELPDVAGPRPPEAEASEAEWFRLLDAALAALPLEQRTAFVLAEVQGLALDEVARVEGVPVGTVKSRLARAREKLRGLLPRPAELP